MKRLLAVGFLIFSFSLGALATPLQRSQQPSATEQLKDPDEKVRVKAVREIAKRGEVSAVPALATALGDASAKVRREVVVALAQFRVTPALDALLRATRDADAEVRELAVVAAVGYYTGRPPRVGFGGFIEKHYRSPWGGSETVQAPIDPGVVVDPAVVTALIQAMDDLNFPSAAREAASGLGTLMAKAAVPYLVKAAHSADDELARRALYALGTIRDTSVGPQVVDLLDSPSKEVRREAAVTVGKLVVRAALPKLQAAYQNDSDEKTRVKAFEGLAYLGDPASVPIFTEALRDDSRPLRISAAEGLARARDSKAVAELEKAINEERDERVRIAERFALTALDKVDYLAALVHELGSRRYADAARAYLIELSHDEKFLPKLYPFLSEHESAVRRELCTVLMHTGNQSSLEYLDRLQHDPESDVAAQALRAAAAIRGRTSQVGTAQAAAPQGTQ